MNRTKVHCFSTIIDLDYSKLEYGDIAENLDESGYRTDGIYIVDKDNKIQPLAEEPDEYGTLILTSITPSLSLV